MRMEAVILPDLGFGSDTPIVVSHWFARLGEELWEGDRLVEVVAGAVTFDVSAPCDGVLARIARREDDVVVPGAPLGWVASPFLSSSSSMSASRPTSSALKTSEEDDEEGGNRPDSLADPRPAVT